MSIVTRYEPGDKGDRRLAADFRNQPVGHHSKDLQRLLNRFRGEPIEGKYILICTKPHKEWVLGQLTGRGKPVKQLTKKFTNREDGEWEIFRRRWKRYTGKAF